MLPIIAKFFQTLPNDIEVLLLFNYNEMIFNVITKKRGKKKGKHEGEK